MSNLIRIYESSKSLNTSVTKLQQEIVVPWTRSKEKWQGSKKSDETNEWKRFSIVATNFHLPTTSQSLSCAQSDARKYGVSSVVHTPRDPHTTCIIVRYSFPSCSWKPTLPSPCTRVHAAFLYSAPFVPAADLPLRLAPHQTVRIPNSTWTDIKSARSPLLSLQRVRPARRQFTFAESKRRKSQNEKTALPWNFVFVRHEPGPLPPFRRFVIEIGGGNTRPWNFNRKPVSRGTCSGRRSDAF